MSLLEAQSAGERAGSPARARRTDLLADPESGTRSRRWCRDLMATTLCADEAALRSIRNRKERDARAGDHDRRIRAAVPGARAAQERGAAPDRRPLASSDDERGESGPEHGVQRCARPEAPTGAPHRPASGAAAF